jgi:hypothetical protein
MALDEQLRQLASDVPAPPPGDVETAVRRGVRRRRARQAAGVAAAVAVVAVAGVGVGSLLDASTVPQIANRPPAGTGQSEVGGDAEPADWPVITGPPALTLSGGGPFTWTVALSPSTHGRWCATAVRGTTEDPNVVGQPCDQVLTPERAGDPERFGTGGSEAEATASGETGQGLSWGFAPAGTEEVFVLFSDGSRVQAAVAEGGSVPAPVWAIGYDGVEVEAVEARRGEKVIAGHILNTGVSDDGPPATPQAVYGDLLQRQNLAAFTDEQRQLLGLQATDELFELPIEGTADRSVGIRVRDGFTPLMFATACGLLDQVDLPDGWTGLCLEHTDPAHGRVRGLFPHGTTSAD